MKLIFVTCFWISIISFAIAIFISSYNLIQLKRKKLIYVMTIGIFISCLFILLPEKIHMDNLNFSYILKGILLSIHQTISVFLLNDQPESILNWLNTSNIVQGYGTTASWLVIILYLAAPVTTVSAVISFFSNASTYLVLYFKRKSDLFIFSSLDKRSITLAESIAQNRTKLKKPYTILFTETAPKTQIYNELQTRLMNIGALTIKKSFDFIKPNSNLAKGNIFWFALQENEESNIEHSISIMELCKNILSNKKLRLFTESSCHEAELILKMTENSPLLIKRINRPKSTIEKHIYEEGSKLFAHADVIDDTTSIISCVIVGLGNYGTQMLKTLVWACQIEGWQTVFHVYDKDPFTYSRFYASAPELVSQEHNGNKDNNEARYLIKFHDCTDCESEEFRQDILSMQNITYVFVALGTDKKNIDIAIRIRELCKSRKDGNRMTKTGNILPDITAVVTDTNNSTRLFEATNCKNEPYDVKYIGSLEDSYSVDTLINSDLENKALSLHKSLKGNDYDFWNYEYNYSSSIARTIHMKLLHDIKFKDFIFVYEYSKHPNTTITDSKITEADENLSRQEHCRWNAWIRSKGWQWSGSIQKSTRSDLGKLHNLIVPYNELPIEEKAKDKYIKVLMNQNIDYQ